MKIVMTGAAGFIGRKLIRRLLNEGTLIGSDGQAHEISKITALDVVSLPEEDLGDPRIESHVVDISDRAALAAKVDNDTDSIYHLAAIVSGGAEEDFDLGYQINLNGTVNVLEVARTLAKPPKVIFSSSVAAYGGELPRTVGDDTPIRPQTSYGAQKVMGEYLITDYSRKGYVDGRAIRLPTIVVRPGVANKAASSFASAIVREPLNGIDYACPVSPESAMAIMSPRSVIDAFVHIHNIPAESFTASRALLLPGFTVSMAEVVEVMQVIAGERNCGAITFEIDPFVQAIVDGWPAGCDSERARALGFKGDDNFMAVVRAYIEDELE
jgi:nucleoside-diphosphate-sugar epimerase